MMQELVVEEYRCVISALRMTSMLGNEEAELQELTNRVHNISAKFGMEISKEKSKTMVSGSGEEEVKLEIRICGEVLEQVKRFKYLRATIKENGTSEQDIRNRIGTATSAFVRLDAVWSLKGI